MRKNETNECVGEERGKCRADNEKTLIAMPETAIGKGKQYLADLQFLWILKKFVKKKLVTET